jgi:hypothetical protein
MPNLALPRLRSLKFSLTPDKLLDGVSTLAVILRFSIVWAVLLG